MYRPWAAGGARKRPFAAEVPHADDWANNWADNWANQGDT